MSDKNKESSPPPLLLMGAAEGLTLAPATGASLLMPVPQTESSLMAAGECNVLLNPTRRFRLYVSILFIFTCEKLQVI